LNKRTKLIIAGGAVAVAALGGATAAHGASTDDDGDNETETPMTGPDLDRASQAALAYTGGGEVTDTEVDDEESYYEVEVRLPDGRQVDVQLNEQFEVVGTDGDDPSGDD
jgi:uncharacterized membrane protein YkoI